MSYKSRVLIVEDDRAQAILIEKMLMHLGYVPIGRADTAEKALRMFKSRHPDLVIMDIRLKLKKDGIDAANELAKLAYVSLIYVTGLDRKIYESRIKNTKYVDLLEKPINIDELSQALKKCYI